MNKKMPVLRSTIFILAGIFVGFVGITQYHSYAEVKAARYRDKSPTVFTELQSLYDANTNLYAEIDSVRWSMEKMELAADAAEAVSEELLKKKMLSGDVSVKGQGVEIKVNGDLEMLWFVDFINEFSTAGAEAVGVNGRRITGERHGFKVVSQHRIMLGDELLLRPYTFSAIGNPEVLEGALKQEGGILKRLSVIHPELEVVVEQKEIVFEVNYI